MSRSRWRGRIGILRSFLIYWRPGRQRALRRLYAPYVPAGGLVFDIGAHLGDRTRAFLALGANVVALEPNPRLFGWLQWLLASQARVILRMEAVGRAPGEATLALSLATPTVSTLSTRWRRELVRRNASFRGVRWEESASVQVTTLDALVAEHGLPCFCKIDVEGYEAEVLAGVSQALPALSIEFVSGALDIAVECIDRLQELGNYAFNVIPGERRQFLFAEWVSAADLRLWLAGGAGNVASGDIYARIPADDPQTCSPRAPRSDRMPVFLTGGTLRETLL